MRRRRAFAISIVLASAAPSARADPQPTDAGLAEALFREGRDLLEAGNASAACAKLGESYRLDARLGTLMNLAACHEMEGKMATAWAEFLEAARIARTRSTPDAKKLEETADARAANIEPQIDRVELEVMAAPDLSVRLDGRTLSPAAWSTPVPIDPGGHVIELSRPGYVTQRVEFATDRTRHRTKVRLPALVLAPHEVRPRSEPAPVPQSPFRRPAFITAGAITVVALGVTTFFGVRAIDAKNSRDDACDPVGCSRQGLAFQEDANDYATVATVFGAVAIASAGIALAALLWPTSKPPNAALGRF